MKIGLIVEYENGTRETVEARFADFVSFERTWQRSVARFEHEIRLTDLAWLAWSSLTRANKTDKKFDPDWINTVANVEMADTEPEPGPLEITQPPTS
jgi:hypothetical protein